MHPRKDAGAGSGNKARSYLRNSSSLIAVCGLMIAGTALAQEAAPAAAAPAAGAAAPAANETAAIIVRGIRQSLANAQNIKRRSDTVVDAITAEDIGALPDRSVTEALQRVPGVSINRFAGSNDPDHFSVEGSGVVVRGLTFVRSEFNGRDAFAAGTSGQALGFADVPAELLGSVEVYKNATAEMIEGGLAGTVNLNTRKPFDKKGLRFSFNAETNYGDMRKEWTPTVSGLISNTWDTDAGTFGALFSGAYSKISNRSDGIQVTNFQTRDNTITDGSKGSGRVCRIPLPGSTDTVTGGANCGTGAPAAGADGFLDPRRVSYAPIGGQFRSQESNRIRDGQAAAFQFKTADEKALFTLQMLRSHTESNWTEYTVEIGSDLSEYNTFPKGCNITGRCPTNDPNFRNYTYDSNNLFTSGYITLPSGAWRGAKPGTMNGSTAGGMQYTASKRQSWQTVTNHDIGFNAKLNPTDHWQIDLDFDYTKSEKKNLDVTLYGSSFADAMLDLRGNLPNVQLKKPNELAYSWQTPNATLAGQTDTQYFSDSRNQFWRSAMDHIEDSRGEQYSVRGDVTYKFDQGSFLKSIKAGLRVTDKRQVVKYSTYNWGMLSEVWSGDNPVTVANYGGSKVSRFNFPDFMRGQTPGPVGGFYYNGDMINDYAGFVNFSQGVQNYYRTNYNGAPTWQPLAQRATAVGGYLPAEVQPLNQRDFNAYVMANFGSEGPIFGNVRMSGNVGVRYVRTNVESIGRIGINSAEQVIGFIEDPVGSGNRRLRTFAERCTPRITDPNQPIPVPTGICTRTEAEYNNLARFTGNGATLFDRGQSSYNYLLPSMNLKFGVGSDVVLRLAASRVMTRPQNDYLRNFVQTGLTGRSLTSQSGNPYLKPALAWQFDITAEWYFSRVGSLTFDAFYKSIDNFFYQEVTNRVLTNNGVQELVSNRGPANYKGTGKIKGFEVAYQQTFDFLPKPFNSLGFSGNYTFIDSQGLPNSFLNGGSNSPTATVPKGNLPLEQLSKHNFNAQLFYENSKFSIRAAYSWRSRFLLTAADVIFPYFSIFNEAGGQLDGSAFVNIGKNVRVGVQGVNLLNQVTRTSQAYTGSPDLLAPRSYFMNDRRFSFVARANF